ncbi:MAG TPA: phosphate ABC transporter permease subunit PstC, partial [Psychrobacter sp.]|nr:phosphate ABC transporter permease subunit PstC [Psychrobacter sp.]
MTDLRSQLAKQKRYDALFVNSTKAFAILVLLSLGGILVSLIVGAWPSIQEFGLGFYSSNNWDTVSNEYGALAPIYGTLVTSFIAIVIAVPVSFGIAIFLTE